MTYAQTLEYLFNRLPMFQRIGAAAYKADLSNTLALCKKLGNPEKTFPSIHIAGTNGKGSVSHFLASILQEAGYKTGLFTSPHLKDFRERIKIDGRMISKREVNSFVENHKIDFNEIQPSFFEWTFALAAWYFSNEKVDIAIIETGMGGRLDSTNVVKPVLTIITNIGLDHTQFLGNTLAAIAVEKAGIIKQSIPVVIGETHEETEPVFRQYANDHDSSIAFADKQVKLSGSRLIKYRKPLLGTEYVSVTGKKYAITSPLTGQYQLKNLATVLCSVEKLQEKGLKISDQHLKSGIRNVIKNTGLKGRWQTISLHPHTIADIGHNADGIREVIAQINITPHEKLHFVIGVVNDKDVSSMLAILPKDAIYYFCKADIPRGLDATELARIAESFSMHGKVFASVKEALESAQKAAGVNDLVLVGGSAFVVAEVV